MDFRHFGKLQVRPVENCLKKNALRPDAVLESVLESLEVNLGIEFGKRVR